MHKIKRVGIIGWHEGSAGLVDSWLPEIGYECKLFIAVDDSYLKVDSRAHSRFGNKRFSYPTKEEFKGKRLFCDPEWYLNTGDFPVDAFVIALDNNEERLTHIKLAMSLGVNIISVVHPTATLLKESVVGSGCIIQAGSIIGYKTSIGNAVIVNTGSKIDHHCVVEDGVTIDPGCVIAGNVLIKELATLHTSTTVINKIVIGKKSISGAGSLVIRDIQDGETVFGVPARPR